MVSIARFDVPAGTSLKPWLLLHTLISQWGRSLLEVNKSCPVVDEKITISPTEDSYFK